MLNSKGENLGSLGKPQRIRYPNGRIGNKLFPDSDSPHTVYASYDPADYEASDLFGDNVEITNATDIHLGLLGTDTDTLIESFQYLFWFMSTSFVQFVHNSVVIAFLFAYDAIMQPSEDSLH
jgi:hypothetical protein